MVGRRSPPSVARPLTDCGRVWLDRPRALCRALVSGSRVTEKAAAPLLPPPRNGGSAVGDLLLRFLLFASCVVAVLVMVTGNQSQLIPIAFPPFLVSRDAKFNHSSAFM
ncbi:Unknown protein [Striga hermonthica]|uniref:CASP-like protein n=1 Tax=Striga hermonthica TaxID=68872 RepID=A0A9N7NVN1_STRHE|nr:Unknown protein [Striga hermonthica]